jgi:hypothetical protein
MIAFEISIDGRKECTAGLPDPGVTSVIASCVRRSVGDSAEPGSGGTEEELMLDVGGLHHEPDGTSVEVRWLNRPLQPGQVITLAVIETATADPPRITEREEPVERQRRKQEYYQRLRQELGGT